MVAPNPSKRVKRRVVVRDYVHIQFEKGDETYSAALVNMSLHGIGCVFPICPEQGELFTLAIQKEDQSFVILAKVKWFQPFESKKRYQVGLEFVDISTEQEQQIQDFLQESLQAPLALPREIEPVPKAVNIRYGDQLEYEGTLISIQQDQIHFQSAHIYLLWEEGQTVLMEADLLPHQTLRSQVTLLASSPQSPPIFQARFPSLSEEERNLIRRFLVEHYLNSD